ncbi:hypothetical protein Tco_0129986 [Tanacetum coccineum]
MDDSNITMEEYIRLEELIGKLPPIPSDPTVCPPNENEIVIRISLDESDDEDYTNVSHFNDLINIIHLDDSKSEKDNDDNDIDIEQSLAGNKITHG